MFLGSGTRVVHGVSVRHGVREGCVPGGYREGYTGYCTQPATLVLPGPNHWLPGPDHWLPGPVSGTRASIRDQGQIQGPGPDSGSQSLKLVNKPECHRNIVMRPAILPISKRGRKVTTLNSKISIFASLLSLGINGPVLDLRRDYRQNGKVSPG